MVKVFVFGFRGVNCDFDVTAILIATEADEALNVVSNENLS